LTREEKDQRLKKKQAEKKSRQISESNTGPQEWNMGANHSIKHIRNLASRGEDTKYFSLISNCLEYMRVS